MEERYKIKMKDLVPIFGIMNYFARTNRRGYPEPEGVYENIKDNAFKMYHILMPGVAIIAIKGLEALLTK